MFRIVQPEMKQKTKKILVVDDYIPTRNLIVETLNQVPHYSITEANDGPEALRFFEQGSFDLVISDVLMPGMSGMDLLRRIRQTDPAVAVMMITGHPTTDLTVSAIKKGAVDFLSKPFDIDELLYKVEIHLRQKDMLAKEGFESLREQDKLAGQTNELSKQGYIYDSIEDAPMDNDIIFRKIADLALKLVDGEVCAVLLFDESDAEFHVKVVRGSEEENHFREMQSPALVKVFHDVIAKKEAVMIHANDPPDMATSLICAPLTIRNTIIGLLCIRKKNDRELFNENDLQHILSLTRRASLNLENKILYESIYLNIMDTLRSLISSIQARDAYTEEHSERVTGEALRLAAFLNCSATDLESLRIAGILHDLGKIATPDGILLKKGRLTDEEYTVIKNHAAVGENILKPIILLDKERKIIHCHHERWDGRGYPLGLKGSEIPLLARILSVVDSYDAMTNNRPYRAALSREKALLELTSNRGTQFDPDVVDAYLKIL
ncbi:MAG: response regulator [Deltaproteobacteria bacterium]|jgi:putative nucleotidyltransferase with HDIG domain|nr:response regulator [Syntrophaceae bacterium]